MDARHVEEMALGEDVVAPREGGLRGRPALGGIIALPLIGFYIIPQYGLSTPSVMIGILIGMIPFIKLVSQKKYMSILFLLSA